MFSWTFVCPPFHNMYAHDPCGGNKTILPQLRAEAPGISVVQNKALFDLQSKQNKAKPCFFILLSL